uniref:AlNc14C261G9822 protein n=1 Tax=Albugo laibachii Nc14 TaxID=890382 RepID=F0WCN7_9STRA|nr:AlNc14C60G4419 [Albugo laibachii Nc14]CCA24843.1 AlNc14C261G9822 [Albugo laibachii Nc14]|eukprot:CCA24843.1 AlNc14C261G9822 [Albugo laibachii Nc14]
METTKDKRDLVKRYLGDYNTLLHRSNTIPSSSSAGGNILVPSRQVTQAYPTHLSTQSLDRKHFPNISQGQHLRVVRKAVPHDKSRRCCFTFSSEVWLLLQMG